MNDLKEDIKLKAEIGDVVREYVELKRIGHKLKGLCPFHSEKTPSFYVDSQKQFFYCFGCKEGGDVIRFIEKVEHLDFYDALKFLADKYHIDVDEYKKNSSNSKEYVKTDIKKYLLKINLSALNFYKSNLKLSDEAYNYLLNRGIDDNLIETFDIGLSMDKENSLNNYISDKKVKYEDLVKAGLLNVDESKRYYYDRFVNRIMFPIKNIHGDVVGFGGRSIGDKMPKYLNSPETVIFNKSNTLYNINIAKDYIKEKNYLILVEGYMDVIKLHKYGYKNVIATLGTAFTDSHAKYIKRYTNDVVIIYDGDEAGMKAAKKASDILYDEGVNIRVVYLLEKLDPDEFLEKYGNESFDKLIDNALNYFEYNKKILLELYDINTLEGKESFYIEILKILIKIPDNAIKDSYARELSSILNYDKDEIKKDARYSSENKQDISKVNSEELNELFNINKLGYLERRVLYLSLISNKYYRELEKSIRLKKFEYDYVKNILLKLSEYYKVYDEFNKNNADSYFEVDELIIINDILKKYQKNDKEVQIDYDEEVTKIIINMAIEILDNELKSVINEINSVHLRADLTDKQIEEIKAKKRKIFEKLTKEKSTLLKAKEEN